MSSNSEKVISYALPKCDFVCPEATELGADGRDEHSEFETFINWMLKERTNTLAMARQMGYGHALLPHEEEMMLNPSNLAEEIPNPMYKRITFEQNDVARTYLQQRFTGNSIKQFVNNKLAQYPPLNANDIFAAIDGRYSLSDDCQDLEAVKRRSKQALKALWKAAPMWYAIFNHLPIEWNGQEVTEDTNIRQWLQAVLDEQGAHDNLLGHIKDQLTAADQRQEVATVDRILEKIKSHPHLAFPWMEMHSAFLDQCEVFHENGACYNPVGNYLGGKVSGYTQTFTYYYEKRAQHRARLDEAAKNAPIPEVSGITKDTTEVLKLPDHACRYYFYGDGECRFGDKCRRSHDGIKGSGGPWKSKSVLLKEKKRDPKRGSDSDEEKPKSNSGSKEKQKKRGRTCYICESPDHLSFDCPKKKKTKNHFNYEDEDQDDRETLKKLCSMVRSATESKKKNHYKEFMEWKKSRDTSKTSKKIAAVMKKTSDEGSDLDSLEDIDALLSKSISTLSVNKSEMDLCEIPNMKIIGMQVNKSRTAKVDESQNEEYLVNNDLRQINNTNSQSKVLTSRKKVNYKLQTENLKIAGLYKTTYEKNVKIAEIGGTFASASFPMFDSGAAVDATGDIKLFSTLKQLKSPLYIYDAGNNPHMVTQIGDIHLWSRTINGYHTVVKFKDIQYSPTLKGWYVNTTTLRTKHGWSCDGSPERIIWVDPLGNKFKLKIIHGNEFLPGTVLTGPQSDQSDRYPQINGFVAETFHDKLKRMSLDDVSNMIEQSNNNLSQWEIEESRIKLAKAGRYIHTSERDPLLALHHQLGHVHWRVVAKYAKQHDIKLPHVAKIFCMACMKAKQKKTPRGKEIDKLVKTITHPEPYTQWSADVFGPIKGDDSNKIIYQLLFVDNGSHTIKSYPLEHLRGIPDVVAKWIHDIRQDANQMNVNKINVRLTEGLKLRTDSAQYWKSSRMREILQREQIYISFSPPYTQWRNAFAERTLGVISNMTKALIRASGLDSKRFWPYAWAQAVQIYDLLPRNANPNSISPYEMRMGIPPQDITKILRPFGQPCSVWRPITSKRSDRVKVKGNENKVVDSGKFHADKARPGKIIGYDYQSSTAKIVLMDNLGKPKNIVTSMQFQMDNQLPSRIFNPDNIVIPHEEDHYYYSKEQLNEEIGEKTNKNTPDEQVVENYQSYEIEEVDNNITSTTKATQNSDDSENVFDINNDNQNNNSEMITGGQGVADTLLIDSDDENCTEWRAVASDHPEVKTRSYRELNGIHYESSKLPYTLKHAIRKFPEHEKETIEAAQNEVQGIINKCLQPYQRDQLKKDDKISTLLSIYSQKTEAGIFDKMKCRCCYRGETEQEGIDYILTRTDMPRLSTLRIFMAMVPIKYEQIWKADISQAFLRAELEPIPANERRFVMFPEDISPKDKTGKPQIYKMHRGIYGMHSAGRMWQEMLVKWLKDSGLTQNYVDPTWFTSEGITLIIWTDDLLIRGIESATNQFKKKLISDFGDVRWKPLTYALGMDVSRDNDGWLGISSQSYCNKVIEKHNMQNIRPRITPLVKSTRITKYERAPMVDEGLQKKYLSLLGQLVYMSTWTRPDITYATSCLSTVAKSPTMEHYKQALRVLSYCKGTAKRGLNWGAIPSDDYNKLIVYTDANWAQETDYCSQSAAIFMLNGAPIHWLSKRQEFPALSSTEAEIMASCTALREILYLRRFLKSIGLKQGTTHMKLDSKNAILFNVQEKVSKRNHHIGARYMRVRYHVDTEELFNDFVATEEQLADIGTKCPEIKQFVDIRNQLVTIRDDGALEQGVGIPSDVSENDHRSTSAEIKVKRRRVD